MSYSLIPTLIAALQRFPETNQVENPYLDPVCAHNLKVYLKKLCDGCFSGHLLVGEMAEYNGCMQTGIPFTSGQILKENRLPFIEELRPEVKIPEPLMDEPMASLLWKNIETTKVPAFWNAFPFHSYYTGNRQTNRPPTPEEINKGLPFLEMVEEILRPHTIFAIGRSVAKTLEIDAVFPKYPIDSIRERDFSAALKKNHIGINRKVGIFWIHQNEIIGKAYNLDDCVAMDGWIDCSEDQLEFWEKNPVFSDLRAEGIPWFNIPMGKVVWHQEMDSPFIFCKGITESPDFKKLVIDFFNLDSSGIFWTNHISYFRNQRRVKKSWFVHDMF